jgi:type VI secretion system protein ImpC
VVFGAQTVQRPPAYDRPEATVDAAIAARLPFVMATGRFMQTMMVMGRDKIGSFMSAPDCETWLNRWVVNYVNGDVKGGAEMRARYPLREARIEIVPEDGRHRLVAHLRPWLQMEELATSLRVEAWLPGNFYSTSGAGGR